MIQANQAELEEYAWAITQMKPGITYVAYKNNELIEHSKDKVDHRWPGIKISAEKRNDFIARLFICRNCGELFILTRKTDDFCTGCRELLKDKDSIYTTKLAKQQTKRKARGKKVYPKTCAYCSHIMSYCKGKVEGNCDLYEKKLYVYANSHPVPKRRNRK